MEDDDEFGDLYTDVLQPLQTTTSAPPIQSTPSRSIYIDRIPIDDEEILYGSKNQNLTLKLNLNKPGSKIEKFLNSGTRVFEKNLSFVVEVDKDEFSEVKEIKDENMEENFGIEDAGDAGEDEFMIPGLSASGAQVLEPGGREQEQGGGDVWDDSDSEDDLQIVLNDDDTGVGMMGMEGGGGLNEEDEGGDDLVIVTGGVDSNHMHHQPMEEVKDWGEDVDQVGEGGGERNELVGGNAGKKKAGLCFF